MKFTDTKSCNYH